MSDGKKSLDETVQEEKPNLEEIATRLGNMEERHRMDQLLPTVMDAFVNYKGVKYKDDKGVKHYKTKFTAKEAKNMAESIFDKLAYHAHFRRYGEMTHELFEQLKKQKDPDGTPLMEAEVQRAFGITKTELINSLLDNRDNLTTDHFAEIVRTALAHHKRFVFNNVVADLREEHADYIADFIKKKVKDHKLPASEYEIKKPYTLKEVLPHYQKLAAVAYKKEKKDAPAAEG